MKTKLQVDFIQPNYLTPSQFLLIICTMLGSFALGLIPLTLLMGNIAIDTVPSEATLWNVIQDQ